MKRLRRTARPSLSVRPRAPATETRAPLTGRLPQRTRTRTVARCPARTRLGETATRSLRAAASAGGGVHDDFDGPVAVTTTSTRVTPGHAATRSSEAPAAERTRPPRTSTP